MASPTLERLGFQSNDRVAIIHADDIGMCHAANEALTRMWSAGVLTSCAVMVPCPWFREAAAIARTTPGMDMGVHITLTSEWDTYRWGPISTRDPASGLLDEEGYFWRSVADVVAHADPDAVAAEMRAQVETALRAGIDATHIDAHMGTALQPPFVSAYVQLGIDYNLPVFIPRFSQHLADRLGFDDSTREQFVALQRQMDEINLLQVDSFATGWGHAPEQHLLEGYRAAFATLEPGLTHVICHPSRPGNELEAITPRDWLMRATDEYAFGLPAFTTYLDEIGVYRLGYRQLRDVIRGK